MWLSTGEKRDPFNSSDELTRVPAAVLLGIGDRALGTRAVAKGGTRSKNWYFKLPQVRSGTASLSVKLATRLTIGLRIPISNSSPGLFRKRPVTERPGAPACRNWAHDMATNGNSAHTLPVEETGPSEPALSDLTTNSGFRFKLRRANENDGPLLAEFFSHVTEDDLRFRFLSGIGHVGPAQLALLTQVDHRRSENLLAFHPLAGFLLASAMLAIDDDPEQAEVAIVIHSDFKNRGVGWCLLDHISKTAAAMGVKTLRAIESRDNRSAIQVERDMGFTSSPCPDDSRLVLLEKTIGTGTPERAA